MQSDRRVALIIGCAAYSLGPLDNPVRDATALEACFKRLGFDEVTLVPNPKLAQLGRKLADFAVAAEDAEMAAIYFAGHGIEANGNNYLIPCDAELGHARRLDFEAIKLADIMRTIDHSRRHLRLIILDACRNNPYRGRMRGLDVRRSVEGGLGYVEPRGNMLVAYAAEHGRTALDGDWGGNSPYAKALLSHLETPNLEIRLLFGRVRDDVFRHTKEDQTPHLYGTLGGQEIYLKRNGVAAPRPSEPITQPPQSEPLRSRADQLWEEFKISTATDLELIQAYIAQMERDGEALAVWKARQRLAVVVAELKRLDEEAWVAAVAADTAAAYQTYVQERPSGARVEDARARLDALAEDKSWRAALSSRDAEALEKLLALSPDSPHADDARRLVAAHEEHRFKAKGFIGVNAWTPQGKERRWIAPGSGEAFRDVEHGPEMVMVPRGEFLMGSLESEEGRSEEEGPQHRVTIPEPFAIGRYPVTFAEWDAFVAAKEGNYRPNDEGWGRGNRPVINVSWQDVHPYLDWLRQGTGFVYRLPSEAEWEYAARAGTQTRYFFGDDVHGLGDHAWNRTTSGGKTYDVGAKRPNSWGLCDVYGSVWEWCEDQWHGGYAEKPEALKATGSAWKADDGSNRVLRGGSWVSSPPNLRSAFRRSGAPDFRLNKVGFRVARTLSPL